MCCFSVEVCPTLPLPTHGKLNSTVTLYGTSVEVTCHTGYTFSEGNYSMVVTCEDGGFWSDSYTNCTGENTLLIMLRYDSPDCLSIRNEKLFSTSFVQIRNTGNTCRECNFFPSSVKT